MISTMLDKLEEFVKDNWLKTVAGVIVSVATIVTALWSIDEHYAKAADLEKVEKKIDTSQKGMALELQIQLNKQSIRDLQSKVEDIEAKEDVKKADSVDQARKKRLLRQLDEIQRETNTLTRQKYEVMVK